MLACWRGSAVDSAIKNVFNQLLNTCKFTLVSPRYKRSEFHFNDTRLKNDLEEDKTDGIFPTKIYWLVSLLFL